VPSILGQMQLMPGRPHPTPLCRLFASATTGSKLAAADVTELTPDLAHGETHVAIKWIPYVESAAGISTPVCDHQARSEARS